MLTLFPLLVLLPLLVALLLVAIARPNRKSGYIAAVASLASLVLLFFVPYGTYTISWFTVGLTSVPIVVTVAQLNLLLLAVIFLVGALVHLYSSGYMDTLSEQKRFYTQMIAFEISMAAFAMSGNFIMLFISWEFLSLFSYLLIGFWRTREKAVRAARLAITTVLIGDIAMIAAIAIFWNIFGSFEFATILAAIPTHISLHLYAGVLLLFVAILTKSAQFPFQEWLPEAMEGPTPVSAFLHSSTMVKAGVFAAIILMPLFSAAGILPLFLIFGLITAAIATLNAMRETHIKKVIAHSTVQELSLMLVAIGSGAVIAAIYLFIVQSFYKALLFFVSGGVMKATNEETIDKARGLRSNRLLYISAIFGVLSVAGLVPFSGFFADAGVGSALLSTNIIVYALVAAIGLGTSVFIFRWFFQVSGPDASYGASLRYGSLPRSMVYPALILAALTLAASALILPISGFLMGTSASAPTPAYLSSSAPISISILDAVVITALFALGAAISYSIFRPAAAKTAAKAKSRSRIGYTHPIFLAFYNGMAKFVYEISEGIGAFDLYLSAAFDWLGHFVVLCSRALRRASVGGINPYALVFAIGIVALLVYAYFVI